MLDLDGDGDFDVADAAIADLLINDEGENNNKKVDRSVACITVIILFILFVAFVIGIVFRI